MIVVCVIQSYSGKVAYLPVSNLDKLDLVSANHGRRIVVHNDMLDCVSSVNHLTVSHVDLRYITQ